jgi:hypothetical protein
MELDNQIAMPIIIAFALFFAFLPLVIIGIIETKFCVYILMFGLISLPLNLLWLVGVRDIIFIDAVTLNFSGGTRGIMTSYYITVLGFSFTIVSLLRKLVKKSSNKSFKGVDA